MNLDVEKIIREYIAKTVHMSLATSANNKPWVCEVHFVYDDSLNLYWRSVFSRRHSQEIEKNPHVAGNIVTQHGKDEYPHAIYFEGLAEVIEGVSEKRKVLPLFKSMGLGEDILEEAATADGHKFYKATVENWYAFGKFGGEKGQKHKLVWNGGKR
jgi:nitroimidazol reductase NimA-like FMN-containing flavoprotein (pyridoxamine 5'-phosphate oxidase superfamily)